MKRPQASIIILNYNGMKWIERCVASLREQTIFDDLEIIIADNQSSDGSDRAAERLIAGWPNARFIQNGGNFGYCEGNNLPAREASGEYLFFLNNDTWLEPDCMEVLLRETRKMGAAVATPLVMNFDDDEFQWVFVCGFDIFGLCSFRVPPERESEEMMMPPGCSYLIERELFHEVGGFDREIFMYADEWDLSWKSWIAGRRAAVIPAARMHHRGAVNVNPAGGEKVVEFRTSAAKRYFANRNCLMVLLKNAQHLLLLLVPLQLALLLIEGAVGLLLTRRWGFIRRAYWEAVRDCWRLRGHILAERAKVAKFRRRSDFFMLRFLRLRLSRWDEIVRMARFGVPKV